MIVVGIPSYNEADNIGLLTKTIDTALQTLHIDAIIVNADSASTDNTTEVFIQTATKSTKVALTSDKKGKGYNVQAILQFTASTEDAEGCVLIDGDITSFEPEWLLKQIDALRSGKDFIVPTYARNYQEGNTTNHFAYPLIGMHFQGKAPRQPLSGDFGISKKFVQYMLLQKWHSFTYGYGIDIFLSLHAMKSGHRIAEVALGKKIHTPSFSKMIPMFKEVATSYYETMRILSVENSESCAEIDQIISPLLTTTNPLSDDDISKRRSDAYTIYCQTPSLLHDVTLESTSKVDEKLWAKVLIDHENIRESYSSEALALSILPWYLMRASTYLETCKTPEAASKEINSQFAYIVNQWSKAA